MQIVHEIHQGEWNKFIAANSTPASFLQTYEWGEFQKSLGLKIYRIAAVGPPAPQAGALRAGDSGEYIAAAQAIVRPLPLGKTYLEVAKGPVWNMDVGIWNMVIKELKKIGRRENSILMRVNPPYEKSQFDIQYSIFHIPEILLRQTEPNDTVLVDLSKSEEDLLAQMHEKSRYNIRLALKKGVKVSEKTADNAAFEKFLELIGETAKRDGITVWPRERFEKFRKTFMVNNPSPARPASESAAGRQPPLSLRGGVPPLNVRGDEGELLNSPRAILLAGEYEGQTLASAIVMLFGDSATYLYAASSAEMRNANVPSLVLWEAIRQAKAAGKKYYDMWGIAPSGASEDHSWAGITRFKTRYVKVGPPASQAGALRAGETGIEKHYTGTWDLVLDKKYYTIFKIGKILRKILPV